MFTNNNINKENTSSGLKATKQDEKTTTKTTKLKDNINIFEKLIAKQEEKNKQGKQQRGEKRKQQQQQTENIHIAKRTQNKEQQRLENKTYKTRNKNTTIPENNKKLK